MMRNRKDLNGRAWIIVLVLLLAIGAIGFGVHRMVTRDSGESAAETKTLWTCPMHPSVIRSEPGSCPICGMDLVQVEEQKTKDGGIEGHGVVEIDPQKQQLIGVVTTLVERRPLAQVVRTVGRVTADESRLSNVHTKIEGWIETLYADETGRMVRKGEPLLTIYSPSLVSTQEEYLLALRSQKRAMESPFPEVRESGESLLRTTRQRLSLWDIPEKDIRRLEETGKVLKALTLYAPVSGYIIEKHALEGMRVTPGMMLYTIADLSRVWIEADVYEFEASMVKEGQQAKATLAALPGRVFQGRVTYIYPTVKARTRTLTARLEFANPKLELKPDMYADVEIVAPTQEALAIPQEAVLDSGTRKVVFVQEEEGIFSPREVVLGPRAAGYHSVLSGLEEGERVVSSPNFLIDSESRFQASKEMRKADTEEAPAEHIH